MSEFRISIKKSTSGNLSFMVAAPGGVEIIGWTDFPRTMVVDYVDLDMSAWGGTDGMTDRATATVHAAVPSPPWRESLEDMGLLVEESNVGARGHHIRIMQDGKCAAQWWPGKGTTLDERQQRGPRCETAEDLVAWLKSM